MNDCDDDTEEEIDSRGENYVHYIDIRLRYAGRKDSIDCKLHQSMRLSSVPPEGLPRPALTEGHLSWSFHGLGS